MQSAVRSIVFVITAFVSASALHAQILPIMNAETNTSASRRAYIEETRKNVLSLVEQFRTRWKTKDVDGLVDLFADDGVLIPSHSELRQGHDPIRESLGKLLPGASELRISVTDFDPADRLIYASGHYTFDETPQGGHIYEDDGTFVFVLKKENNTWRIRSAVFRPDNVPES